jgi:cytidylate kinase
VTGSARVAHVAEAAPVITIDGPTASGKGAVAESVARAIGWHYLDSGALYRLVALHADGVGCPPDDEAGLAALAVSLPARFEQGQVWLNDEDVTLAIRQNWVGNEASRIAVLGPVRAALVARQRAFARPPGLVADGRDMATVIFPDAPLQVYLTASLEVRAQRRLKQLIEKGFSANLPALLRDIAARDARDENRAIAPLKPSAKAVFIDSSDKTLEQVINEVLAQARKAGLV